MRLLRKEKPMEKRDLNMKLKIMIVDDEPDVCDFMGRFLSREGYEVLSANNGQEAIDKCKTHKPNIILLDIRMPRMDGIECLKKIKEADKDVGVIMTTMVEDEETAKKALELGAYDYITKPISLDYLKACVLTKAIFMAAK